MRARAIAPRLAAVFAGGLAAVLFAAPVEAGPVPPQIAQHLTGRLMAAPGASVHETARWGEDVDLGADVRIGPGVRLGDRVLVGDGSEIGKDVVIGADALLGRRVTVRAAARIGAWARIGDGARIGRGAAIGARVSVAPDSEVPDGAVVALDE